MADERKVRARIQGLKAEAGRLAARRREIRRALATLRRRLARHQPKDAPRIVTGVVSVRELFGPLGPERYVTGHHTAGPKDVSLEHAIQLCKSYHAAHAAKGWGGIGYHFCIARTGELICLRPTYMKGAHVGGWNSNNLGVVCHGTLGDRPTEAQRRTFAWLVRNAHTAALPKAHRADRDLSRVPRRGHNDWPDNPTSCPGDHKPMFVGPLA